MTKEKLNENILNYINEMPSLPVSAGKVLEICGTLNVNPSDLNKVISLDPVLTGRLLKLINSAYYGLNTHITSLVKAITMLGLNNVKNLVLSMAVLSVLPKNKSKKGLNMSGYWQHCLCVGVASKLLAAKQGITVKQTEEYFLAGLLHDLGKIPLNAVLCDDYMNLITTADSECKSLSSVENDSLGIDHSSAGVLVSSAWKLDSTINDVIGSHHDVKKYKGGNSKIVCTVAAANYLSNINEIGFAGNRKPLKPDKEIWDTIGLNNEVFKEITENLFSEIDRAKIFLHIS